MSTKAFGQKPSGKRLQRILQSPHYRDGSFQNMEPTEVLRKGASYLKMLKDYFHRPETVEPLRIPAFVKTDLKQLDDETPCLIWFGHSSYLIASKGFRILVDPVLFGTAAPVSFFGKPFKDSTLYSAADLPDIDLLIITHDHYDHLDYQTITRISSRVKRVVTALGVGAHLEFWGMAPEKITELDWWEEHRIDADIHLTATPARHFSGRTLKRGCTLWTSFVLDLHGYRLFLGGDSGYDGQFRIVGERFGGFDLAILECGQYGPDWPYIHMLPEETAQAALDLKAKLLLPVHWGRFVLSNHEWNDPVIRVTKKAKELGLSCATPMIGEPLVLGRPYPQSAWWR